MKENILKIIDAVCEREEFLDKTTFELTVNYKQILYTYPHMDLTQKTQSRIKDELNKIDDIWSFNFTVHLEIGCEDRHSDDGYAPNWKSGSFTFYGSKKKDGEDEEEMMPPTHARFIFDSIGDRESFRTYDKMMVFDHEKERRVPQNLFRYDKINELLEQLIQLDVLLDRQHEEKNEIYTKLKTLST